MFNFFIFFFEPNGKISYSHNQEMFDFLWHPCKADYFKSMFTEKKKSCCMVYVNWCQLKPRNLYTLPIINTTYGFSNIASILLEKKNPTFSCHLFLGEVGCWSYICQSLNLKSCVGSTQWKHKMNCKKHI